MRSISFYVFGLTSLFVSPIQSTQIYQPDESPKGYFEEQEGELNYLGIEDNICEAHNCCFMNSTSTCTFDKLEQNSEINNFIFPPYGSFECQDPNNPYFFRVYAGDKDKVVFFFQSGGGCSTEYFTNGARMCSHRSLVDGDVAGIFNRAGANNPYLHHTIVEVIYCSGDFHVGDATQDFNRTATNDSEEDVLSEHRGVRNGDVALDWLLNDPVLQPPGGNKVLNELVIMGCSAGSMGAQVWAGKILSKIQAKQKTVISDSLMGVFPNFEAEQHFFKAENFCNSGLLDWHPRLMARCNAGKMHFKEVLAETMIAHRDTIFLVMNSPKDPFQLFGYLLFDMYLGKPGAFEYEPMMKTMKSRVEEYTAHPNFVSAWSSKREHCFTGKDEFLANMVVHGTFGGAKKEIYRMSLLNLLLETRFDHNRVLRAGNGKSGEEHQTRSIIQEEMDELKREEEASYWEWPMTGFHYVHRVLASVVSMK